METKLINISDNNCIESMDLVVKADTDLNNPFWAMDADTGETVRIDRPWNYFIVEFTAG